MIRSKPERTKTMENENIKIQEAMGKTVDDAVSAAKAMLKISEDAEVEIEVLEEPKKAVFGLFGGSLAKVRVTYHVPEKVEEPAPTEEPDVEEAKEDEAEAEPVIVIPDIPRTYKTVEKTGVKMAKAFMDQLISDMGLTATTEAYDGDHADTVIDVEGDKAGVLIGHHGETLDALQYLANLAANKRVAGEKHEYCRITVDVEGYRAKRANTLKALARRKANAVLKYKKSIMLEPMNPYERRIIHAEIQNIPGVSTNSIGADDNRRVVIYLSDQKAEPIEDESED